MKKGKIYVFVLLLGILILSTDALALPVGTHFGFYDNVVLPGTNPWKHSLENDDFIPELDGPEPLIIEHAWLLLSLNIKPEYNPTKHKYVFNASIELDGYTLGNFNYSSRYKYWNMNRIWWTSIINTNILNSIGIDREANIFINVSKGTLKYVHNSKLFGHGVVGPEPISMALVGAGLAGLPIAVRFRRLLRK